MADGDIKEPEEGGEKKDGKGETAFHIRIRPLPDIRALRKNYARRGDGPIAIDSNDSPIPTEEEEDFGLKRSTPEEAWEFFRQTVEEDCACEDDLKEFLDD